MTELPRAELLRIWKRLTKRLSNKEIKGKTRREREEYVKQRIEHEKSVSNKYDRNRLENLEDLNYPSQLVKIDYKGTVFDRVRAKGGSIDDAQKVMSKGKTIKIRNSKCIQYRYKGRIIGVLYL